MRGHHITVTSKNPINPEVEKRQPYLTPINHRIDNMFNDIQRTMLKIIGKPVNNGVPNVIICMLAKQPPK